MQMVSSNRVHDSSTQSMDLFLSTGNYDPETERHYRIEDIQKCLNTEVSEYLKIESDIELLNAIYIYNNQIEVRKYLRKHEYLIDILFEAHKQIKITFLNSYDLYMELYKDPEESYEELFIIIKTNLSINQSLYLLNKITEEWWLDLDDKIRKNLEIDVESNF